LTEYRVPLDLKGRLDHKAPLVSRVRKESLACRVLLANRAQQGVKDSKAQPDHKVSPGSRELLDNKVPRDPKGRQATGAYRALQEAKEPPDSRGPPGRKVP